MHEAVIGECEFLSALFFLLLLISSRHADPPPQHQGTQDEIFPIDDYLLALQHGCPKEARFVANTKHMGEPESFTIILKWLYKLFGVDGLDPRMQLEKLLEMRPRF